MTQALKPTIEELERQRLALARYTEYDYYNASILNIYAVKESMRNFLIAIPKDTPQKVARQYLNKLVKAERSLDPDIIRCESHFIPWGVRLKQPEELLKAFGEFKYFLHNTPDVVAIDLCILNEEGVVQPHGISRPIFAPELEDYCRMYLVNQRLGVDFPITQDYLDTLQASVDYALHRVAVNFDAKTGQFDQLILLASEQDNFENAMLTFLLEKYGSPLMEVSSGNPKSRWEIRDRIIYTDYVRLHEDLLSIKGVGAETYILDNAGQHIKSF